MINQLDEKRLGKSKYNIKLRCFPGASINDMYFYLYPLLQKDPEIIILHVGSNDCTLSTSDVAISNLKRLIQYIEETVPGIKVIISQPILRHDIALARITASRLVERINKENLFILNNSNIVRKHVGRKGLHLNQYGTARLAMNLISLSQRL